MILVRGIYSGFFAWLGGLDKHGQHTAQTAFDHEQAFWQVQPGSFGWKAIGTDGVGFLLLILFSIIPLFSDAPTPRIQPFD